MWHNQMFAMRVELLKLEEFHPFVRVLEFQWLLIIHWAQLQPWLMYILA